MRPFTLTILAAFAVLFFSNCDSAGMQSSAKKEVSGVIANAANMRVFFDKSTVGNANTVIGYSEVGTDGSFSIPYDKQLEAGLYRIRVGSKKAFIPIDGTESFIKVNADLNTLDRYQFTVEGVPAATEALATIGKLVNRQIDAVGVQSEIRTYKSSMAGAMVSFLAMNNAQFLDFQKEVVAKLEADHGANSIVGEFKTWVSTMEQQKAAANAGPIAIGTEAPDISLSDPFGKTYTLSDLKGKVVLLDFWASWCGPCRRENPSVVKMYDKYNNQGFEVFSVSLDRENQKQRWVDAINKDNLKWPYHVSDLKFWQSAPARVYGVRSIPRTFLIDRDGKIAAVNMRGAHAIEAELIKIL